MFNAFIARLKQGYRTKPFPYAPPALPENFVGLPVIAPGPCTDSSWTSVCPTQAVKVVDGKISLDLGRCIFCRKCEKACPNKAIAFTKQHDMAAFRREDLIRNAESPEYSYLPNMNREITGLIGKSLKIREVSAGGCAACELDVNVLGTLAWDMGRLGMQIVASPRHADCVLVTGPVSRNMLLALKKTIAAMPKPAFVIANGTCAISGGIYHDASQTCGGFDGLAEDPDLPKPDLYVPGCPPHPATLMQALVRFCGK